MAQRKKTEKKTDNKQKINYENVNTIDVKIAGKKFTVKPFKIKQLRQLKLFIESIAEKIKEKKDASLIDVLGTLTDKDIETFLNAVFMGQDEIKDIDTGEIEINELAELWRAVFLSNNQALSVLINMSSDLALTQSLS